jgi:hypothetical protein
VDVLPRSLLIAGAVLVALGLLLHFAPSLPLGRLPGDIRIERPGLRVVVPITTCLLLSAVLTALYWLFTRWR